MEVASPTSRAMWAPHPVLTSALLLKGPQEHGDAWPHLCPGLPERRGSLGLTQPGPSGHVLPCRSQAAGQPVQAQPVPARGHLHPAERELPLRVPGRLAGPSLREA